MSLVGTNCLSRAIFEVFDLREVGRFVGAVLGLRH